MPRLTKGSTEERENFMLEIFRRTPGLSIPKANAEFTKKFGSMMRNKRVYELRRVAGAKTTTGPETVAARKPHRPTTAARPAESIAEAVAQNLGAALITGSPDQIQFLKTALDQLREEGLVKVRVDHTNSTATAAYAVVAQA